jgi:two-component system, chemotaxis family, CheB/CheR fusion protein
MNEELHSTNEELETMNEELQSTNEELETTNEELRYRSLEVNHVNSVLEVILTSLRVGVIVVDQDLRTQVWNTRSEDLWGLRADEVHGHNFLNLDIGLPVDKLKPILRACLSEDPASQEVSVDAINRRGKPIRCKVSCMPLSDRGDGMRGAILLVEEQGAER